MVRDSDSKATSYDFDASKLTITTPRALKKGRFANVRYKGGDLYMESPSLHLPMGVSSFEDGAKKSLFISCRGCDDTEDVRMFVAALDSLQERAIDLACDIKMLGDNVDRNQVSSMMTPIVKTSDMYPPAFRVALPYRDGKPAFSAWIKDGGIVTPCSIDDMEVTGARINVILSASAVWIVNSRSWGISLKAAQILVKPTANAPTSDMSFFIDEALE